MNINASIICMAAALTFVVLIAIIMPILIKIRWKTDIVPYFIGFAVFMLFAMTLESGLHSIVLLLTGTALTDNMWLYALYGGLAAGIFEETGRFLAMKFVLKKQQNNPYNSLMYGAGHGCFEAVALIGSAMISNIVMLTMINSGMEGQLLESVPPEQTAAMQTVIDQLTQTPAYMYLLSGFERIPSIILHISFSVIVWFAVVNKKTYYFPLAIFLHALVDGVMVILQRSGINIVLIEALLLVISLAAAGFAFLIWKKETKNNDSIAVDVSAAAAVPAENKQITEKEGN